MKAIRASSYLVFLLFLIACNNNKIPQFAIGPPFEGITKLPEVVEVDPTKSSVLRLKNGTAIQIPKNAFVDALGNPVNKPVKLSYKQFTDASEIITSGIPMTFTDKNGGTRTIGICWNVRVEWDFGRKACTNCYR